MPGSIRKAEHFLGFLGAVVGHLRRRLQATHVDVQSPNAFVFKLSQNTGLEAKPLKFCAARLSALLRTLESPGLDDLGALTDVCDFATLVATYDDGFSVVLEVDKTVGVTIA